MWNFFQIRISDLKIWYKSGILNLYIGPLVQFVYLVATVAAFDMGVMARWCDDEG